MRYRLRPARALKTRRMSWASYFCQLSVNNDPDKVLAILWWAWSRLDFQSLGFMGRKKWLELHADILFMGMIWLLQLQNQLTWGDRVSAKPWDELGGGTGMKIEEGVCQVI